MYPHERSLVEKYQGKPFAILGINGGDERELAKQIIADGDVTWPFWFDGDTSGPIHTQWNIQSWPTIVVIDHRGVIRFRDVRETQLDKAIEMLMAEAESAGT